MFPGLLSHCMPPPVSSSPSAMLPTSSPSYTMK
jgi:hypothetical protein